MGLEANVEGTYFPLKVKQGISRISSDSKNIVDKLFKITWPNHYGVLGIIERRLKHAGFEKIEVEGYIFALSELIQNQGIEHKKNGIPDEPIFVGFLQHDNLVSSYVIGNSRESFREIAYERVNRPFNPGINGMGLPTVGLVSDEVYMSEFPHKKGVAVEMKIFKRFN